MQQLDVPARNGHVDERVVDRLLQPLTRFGLARMIERLRASVYAFHRILHPI